MQEHDAIYRAIQAVMERCTHSICSEVDFKYLKPKIVGIFPVQTLQRAQGGGNDRASCDVMGILCDSVRTLSRENFVNFMRAIGEDYPFVADRMEEIWNQQPQIRAEIQASEHQVMER